MNIRVIDGFINCECCNGNGKLYTISFDKIVICECCNGDGIRKPTWTEKIILRNKLKNCRYNYGSKNKTQNNSYKS